MSMLLKSQALFYKDPETGEYVGINFASDKTSAERLENVLGQVITPFILVRSRGEMLDRNKGYVYVGNGTGADADLEYGAWYYIDDDEVLTKGGVFVDNTLSLSGVAADAKIVGDMAFLARRATLSNGDDANNIDLPGSYARPLGTNVSNLPSENSGYLIVFTRPGTGYTQLYVDAYNGFWYRHYLGSWISLGDTPTRVASLEGTAFLARRATLSNGDDANNINLPGSYARPNGTSVSNLPSENSGYLIVFTRPGAGYIQIYIDAYNGFWYRHYLGSWISLGDTPTRVASLENAAYDGKKGTLATGDDANSVYLPGAYAKPASAIVSNVPTQNSGYLVVLNKVSGGYIQMYVDNKGRVFSRHYLTGWNLISAKFDHPLFEKTIVGLGDSLMYGQGLSTSVRENKTWIALLRDTYNMTAYNYGVSGSAVAHKEDESVESMARRIDTIVQNHANEIIDYFVVEGGANDYTAESPLGDLTRANVDTNTFFGALNYIVNCAKATWPKVKILLMTNYDRKLRHRTVDGETRTDEFYVNAILAFANMRGIPVIDNYHGIGVSIRDFVDPAHPEEYPDNSGQYPDNWFFPISLNQHLSVDAYAWLAQIYAKKLESI